MVDVALNPSDDNHEAPPHQLKLAKRCAQLAMHSCMENILELLQTRARMVWRRSSLRRSHQLQPCLPTPRLPLPFWLRPPLAWWRHQASSWHSSPSGGANHKGHLRKRSRAQREAQRMPPMPVLFPALRWLRLTFPRGVCEIPMRIQSHKYMRNDSSCLTCLGTRWSKRCPHGRA